jgi:hypothetical protein
MTMEPLIYTTKGNVPESTLNYAHEWIDTPDVMKFIERYTDKASGEIVKESCHVYLKRGMLAEASACNLG